MDTATSGGWIAFVAVTSCGLRWLQQICDDIDTIVPAELVVVESDLQFLTSGADLLDYASKRVATFKADPDTIACNGYTSQQSAPGRFMRKR